MSYCQACGKYLTDGIKVCHHCGCIADDYGRYCPNCGSEHRLDAVVCPSCGQQLAPLPRWTSRREIQRRILNKWGTDNQQQVPQSPIWASCIGSIDEWIKKQCDFKGKATRKQYWHFRLWRFIVFVIWFALMLYISEYHGEKERLMLSITGVYAVFYLFTLVPFWSITVRRLHDIGKSGWWYFMTFIPIIGGTILLTWLARPTLDDAK